MAMEHFDEKIAPTLRVQSALSSSSSGTSQNPASSLFRFRGVCVCVVELCDLIAVTLRQYVLSKYHLDSVCTKSANIWHSLLLDGVNFVILCRLQQKFSRD